MTLRLSPSTLKQFRKDLEGRDNNSGAPYWTSRVSMLLNHIDTLEEENRKLRQPSLFIADPKRGEHP